MLLLSSAFRIDSAQNMNRTTVPTTSTNTNDTTATWFNLWSDIATWISRKPRHQVDLMFTNTQHHHDPHQQEDVLMGPVSEFQKVYVSFPEFKEADTTISTSTTTNNTPITSTTTSTITLDSTLQ